MRGQVVVPADLLYDAMRLSARDAARRIHEYLRLRLADPYRFVREDAFGVVCEGDLLPCYDHSDMD